MAIKKQGLTFDDVLILPRYSSIDSRSTIDLSQNLWGKNIPIPIISAGMDYVTEFSMAVAMSGLGGLAILHRFGPFNTQQLNIAVLGAAHKNPILSVGIRDIQSTLDDIESVEKLGLFAVNIDVAHGHHFKVGSLIGKIKTRFPALRVIAGNVATKDGYRYLADCGADAIKVGIGPGSACTTRTVTGIGVPQLTAIMDCAEVGVNVTLIADGGIKNSGDIVKALAAGADFVMLGYLLAGHDESPGEIIKRGFDVRIPGSFTKTGLPEKFDTATKYKPYRGQSIHGSNRSQYTPEGVEGLVPYRGPVADTIKKLTDGIRSGMSYVGAWTLADLRNRAEFITVSQGTRYENETRITVSA